MDHPAQTRHNEHFLKAVTELGDTRNIVANCDIHAESGMKLVAAGVRITSSLYDNLVKHKLLPQLELAVSIEDALDTETILSDILEMARNNEKLQMIVDRIDETSSCEKIVRQIPLPAPLAFKLTVAREKYRHIYDHSLLLTVMCIYLAVCDKMSLQEKQWVAAAALFHDIGLLHIDPAMLDPSHTMSIEERRHLYAHPLTAYLLLCEFPELNGHVAEAVLEHHERMDGRGYPRGLHGDKISRYGQVLAVAELAAKSFDPLLPIGQWRKLEVMLKLNSKQYGAGLIGHLTILRAPPAKNTADSDYETEDLIARVKLISILFEDFDGYADAAVSDEIVHFATKRLVALRHDLLSAGFDPHDPDTLIEMLSSDPESRQDYAPLLTEAIWQFKSLLLEAARRWPEKVESCTRQQGMGAGCKWMSELKLKLIAVED
ncbi:MAG: HD domain-containing protein [Nitrosomonadales bacterium]|nr:HD domain-containing protein [Nitrosomonadales bacterium]